MTTEIGCRDAIKGRTEFRTAEGKDTFVAKLYLGCRKVHFDHCIAFAVAGQIVCESGGTSVHGTTGIDPEFSETRPSEVLQG